MDKYWVGGTASWNTTAGSKWAHSSGGDGGEAVPTADDNVFFDANSGAVTVTATSTSNRCKNLNFTGFTGTFAGSSAFPVSGSLTAGAGMTWTATMEITFNSSGSETITSNGVVISSQIVFNGTGSWTLQDDFNIAPATPRSLFLIAGTFNANSFNVTSARMVSNGNSTRSLIMGSGTFELKSGTFSPWETSGSNLTINAGTSTLKFTGTLTANRNFSPAGFNYNFWNATLGNFAITILGSNTFNEIKINAGRTQIFQAGRTQTINSLVAIGTEGNEINLQSTSASQFILSKPSGEVSVEYCNISNSRATGGARWFALTSNGNVNGGNNDGWIFEIKKVVRNWTNNLKNNSTFNNQYKNE